jgi:uncharacterized protein YciI
MSWMPSFAVITEEGPRWDKKKRIDQQDGWNEHFEFMSALVSEGFVLLGGPLEDHPKVQALLIVDAPDEATVRSRLSEEPFIRSGVLGIAELYSWEIRYGRLP